MSVLSTKKRISSGGIIAGLAAAALLVFSIGAGTGSAAIAVAPANTELPTISGTPKVGQTLTASDGKWANAPTSFAYMWLRCQRNGNKCSTIPSATAKTYVLAAADEKQTIRVRLRRRTPTGQRRPSRSRPAPLAPHRVVAQVSLQTRPPRRSRVSPRSGRRSWRQRASGRTGRPGTPSPGSGAATDAASCVSIAGATGKSYMVTSA